MQVDNPNLARIRRQKIVKRALSTLPGNAPQASVRTLLSALIFLLFDDDPDVPTNKAHLPQEIQDALAALED